MEEPIYSPSVRVLTPRSPLAILLMRNRSQTLRGCFPQEELPCLGEIKTTLMGMQRECLIGLFTFNGFRGCNQRTVHHHTLGVGGGPPFQCGCARCLEPQSVRRGPRTCVLEPRTLSLQDMPAGILDLLEGTYPHHISAGGLPHCPLTSPSPGPPAGLDTCFLAAGVSVIYPPTCGAWSPDTLAT